MLVNVQMCFIDGMILLIEIKSKTINSNENKSKTSKQTILNENKTIAKKQSDLKSSELKCPVIKALHKKPDQIRFAVKRD